MADGKVVYRCSRDPHVPDLSGEVRFKRTFHSFEEAVSQCNDSLEAYCCHWCGLFHLATRKTPSCRCCAGSGTVRIRRDYLSRTARDSVSLGRCPACSGTGTKTSRWGTRDA